MSDIRDYLSIRSAAPAGFSPNGETLLVRSDLTGTSQLYRVARGGGELRPITDFAEPVAGIYLPDAPRVLLTMDAGGNERHQIHLIDDDGTNLESRVHDPAHIHRPGGSSRDGSRLAYASNRRNGVDFDVYLHDLRTPAPDGGAADACVFRSGGWCQPVGFSPDGRRLAVWRMTELSGDNDVYLLDLDDPNADALSVAPHAGDASVGAPRWLADGSAFYFATDVDRDMRAIARFDAATGAWTYVLERPWEVECVIDRQGRTLLVAQNADGYTQAELLDAETLEPRGRVALPHPGVAGEWTFSQDGRWLAYQFSSALEPGDVWLCEVDTLDCRRLTTSPCAVDRTTLRAPALGRFESFDGESIPAFVTLPDSTAGKRVPVVVMIHGGPESQSRPAFAALIAYLVAYGYAVVVPNVRGSTGYGKRFHHLDDRRKRLDAVRDLEALHAWLAASDVLDESRAALFGGSYGGYMVLSGLVYQPDLWAAGVDIVGVSNLATFLANTSPWRRKYREREYGSLDEDGEFLASIAPLTHVDRIRAPLFLIHGENDPRVPLSESRQIHEALTRSGIPCELLVYSDEGHGLHKLANRLDAYPRAAAFLDATLGASVASD